MRTSENKPPPYRGTIPYRQTHAILTLARTEEIAPSTSPAGMCAPARPTTEAWPARPTPHVSSAGEGSAHVASLCLWCLHRLYQIEKQCLCTQYHAAITTEGSLVNRSPRYLACLAGVHVCVHFCLPTSSAALASFYIEIDYIGTWTDARKAVFQSAADK